MYSLNAAVPGRVRRIAGDLYPHLASFADVREDHSICVKRLGDDEPYKTLADRARTVLADAPAFEVAVTGIDYFETPTDGTDPVVYLTVESPGLLQVHKTLVEAFGALPGLEGDEYVPHVTLARDGEIADAERLAEREIEPVTWTVSELEFTDAHHDHAIGTIPLGQ
ncbi:phosphoesterase HXTX [Salinarchaeum sp. Harcht-Bsk1]|uniref:2'-5' RNA ligase family protein n=1 Tax=Salinarchaeum sp. Harcht-Bsk1 TaxID=1333523 RepID=UPI000342499A|nr:2'-5' RNA ligase family protein [Salinarchaeum sp. Harcht-Bsk1]AGN01515.1 phosphoesterase HXTX [Salinarchaeum sp. Harcht-Bsk1]